VIEFNVLCLVCIVFYTRLTSVATRLIKTIVTPVILSWNFITWQNCKCDMACRTTY